MYRALFMKSNMRMDTVSSEYNYGRSMYVHVTRIFYMYMHHVLSVCVHVTRIVCYTVIASVHIHTNSPETIHKSAG